MFGDFDEERLFYSKYGAGDMFGDGYHPWGSAAVSKRALNKLDQAMQVRQLFTAACMATRLPCVPHCLMHATQPAHTSERGV